MQQSSATQSLHLSFWGLRKIVAYSHSSSQCLLVPTVFGTVSSLHPTSFLMIFILVVKLIRHILKATASESLPIHFISCAKVPKKIRTAVSPWLGRNPPEAMTYMMKHAVAIEVYFDKS